MASAPKRAAGSNAGVSLFGTVLFRVHAPTAIASVEMAKMGFIGSAFMNVLMELEK